MKKLFMLFGIVMMSLLYSISVFAADTNDSKTWEYEIYGSGVKLTAYKGTQTDVYVPSKILEGDTEYSVLKLGENLFKDNHVLNSATLGEGITEIGDSAFEGATKLVCIVTPESLTTIGNNAFSGCVNFNSVILYDRVTSIGENAFQSCSKLTIYCNENTTAYNYAVNNSVIYKILNPDAEPEIYEKDGVTYYITNGEATAIDANTSVVVIPETIEGYPVTKLNGTFTNSTVVRTVTLPKSLKSISAKTFYQCSSLYSISIPEGITKIDDYAFYGCTSLTRVEIPESVTSIGSYAFQICRSLTSIEIPESVTSMGDFVFCGCTNLRNIKLPSKITKIGTYAFYMCSSLTSIEIPNNVTNIGSYAFAGCTNLTNIEIPNRVTRIYSSAFASCTKINSVIIPLSVSTIYANSFDSSTIWIVYENSYAHTVAQNNSLSYFAISRNSTPEIHIVDGVTYCITNGEAVAIAFDQTTTSLIIPETVEGCPVTELIKTFSECSSLTSIEIPNSVRNIGNYAFSGCSSLTSIKIPDSVESIGSYAFYECTNLASATLSNSMTSIGAYAFYGCKSITSIDMPDSVESIGNYAFFECSSLVSVEMPDSITTIPTHMFWKCSSLTNIEIPSSVKSVGKYAFYGCSKLMGIEIPNNVTSIGEYAFYGCRLLQNIKLPTSLTSIGDNAFYNCSGLTSIEIPNGVKTIGRESFYNCSGLLMVAIPASVKTIYTNSFHAQTIWLVQENSSAHSFAINNGLLHFIIKEGSSPELHKVGGITYFISDNEAVAISFDGSSSKVTIPATVKGYPVTKLRNTFYCCGGITSVTLPDSITAIDDYTFYYCEKLASINMPTSLTTIGDYAFTSCKKLVSIELPHGVTSIGNSAFEFCDNLLSISIPDSVTSIGGSAFHTAGIRSITIPKGITTIKNGWFYNCKYLGNVSIPDSVTNIESYSFYNCTALRSITLPDSVTTIDEAAFNSCSNLTNIKLSNNLVNIGYRAFYDCISLSSIEIPDSVKTIGKEAFSKCTRFKNLKIPNGVTSIGSSAFYNCSGIAMTIIPKSITSISANSFASNTIWLVYENSYAHRFAESNDVLYFVLKKTTNPEIDYGKRISGTAKYTDGTLVSGATVDILYDDGTIKETVKTNASGKYEFTYAEVGRYTIRVTDSNGNTASEVVSVKRMNVFDVYLAGETDLVLKKGYNVSGTVSPDAAKVTISDTNGNVIKSVDVTDGTFTFADIPRGSYIVKAENETGSAITEIYVSNEDVTGISLTIQAQSATISGDIKIENRDGTYSTKIWVSVDLIDSDGNVVARTTTDADGKYTFKNVPEGNYNIVATTTEIRPAYSGNFDKSFELKGYGHVDITGFGEYTVETIILREEKINLTTFSGQVTTNAGGYVYLSDESGNQIAYCETTNNGKFTFKNIPDGVYSITAITNDNGMGFEMISIENGVVYGNTHIKATKANNVSKFEEILEEIPDEIDPENANYHKTYILEAKKLYDDLSEKEQKQVSKKLIDRLNNYIDFYLKSSLSAPEDVVVENEESIISHDELESEESIEFVLTITETTITETDEDGITSDEEYETEKIKDKKGKNKNIAKYYDITFSKNGKNISNIRKQTETNGKLRITMEIPEEHRGHKHYSFIHMHKGEAVTLIDLDNDPDTVTFEIDKFSTFALAFSDVELVGEVEDETYPASITYDEITGKISVPSTEDGTLYIATYEGTTFIGAVQYPVTAGTNEDICEFGENQVAYLWNENQEALCERFTINN